MDDQGAKRYFLGPGRIPEAMDELFAWYREAKEGVHPVLLSARFSSRITRIHPFRDGNGRIARLASNHILLQADYPPVIHKTEQRQEYLVAKAAADEGRDEPLILLITREVEETLVHFLEVLGCASQSGLTPPRTADRTGEGPPA